MTREEILNTPKIVDFMLDESVMADSREKLRKRLEKVCNLAIKALEQEPVLDEIRAEIEPTRKMYLDMNDIDWLNGCDYVLSVIDKYREE